MRIVGQKEAGRMQSNLPVQIITWLVAVLGGGLAGGIATICYNILNSHLAARRRESAIIGALRGEVHTNLLLCGYNAKQPVSMLPNLALFVEFSTLAATKAVFEERQICPRLKPLQQDLEHYVLGLSEVNQFIEHYRTISPLVDVASQAGQDERGSLQKHISSLCAGDEFLEGVGPEGRIGLPGFFKHISEQLKKV
jgi:hypothetical protein